ncbi:MAG: OmpA family protein [Chitinophagaceae bacterium]|nr:OmpA family protein [Chitinophagaceae bacterium]
MKYFRITLLLAFLLNIGTAFSQDSQEIPIQKLSFKKSLKMGDYLYSIGSFFNAAQYYQAVNEKQAGNAYVLSQIADCEFKLRDFKEAEKWYKELVDANDPLYPMAPYYYGLSLKANGKYAEAKTVFNTFEKSYKGVNSQNLKKFAKNQAKGCDLAVLKMQTPDTVKVTHIGANVNAPYTEFGPIPLGDTALLFASLKSDTIIMVDEIKKNNAYAEFYESKKSGENFQKATVYTGAPFNSENSHTGNGCFSPDKKRFYFTRCDMLADSMKMVCAIYLSELKNGKWTDPQKMDDKINFPGSTNTQPNMGTSKLGDILYWVSDRTNGEGGQDIWFSTIDKNGKYANPQSVGRKVNTAANEATPFYDSKTGTLYFSSDGQIGLGGYDIFKTRGNQKKWETAVNIGYPINSSVDDMYYVMDDNGYTGYLVSNRPGTISVKSETCCDDIWRVEYPKKVFYAVRGNVYDQDTRQVIPGAKIIFLDKSDKQIGQSISKKDTLYFWNTKPQNVYSLKATKEGYFTGSATFSVTTKNDNDTARVDVYIRKIPNEPIRVKNIFYDFDKATLRPESFPPLDTVANLLMLNPAIIVEIGANTDSKGDDKYNMRLSQSRAQSVVDYLVQKGIPAERLQAKGYGESNQIAPNTLPDGKDNPEGRQLNRRTEFKIIGTIPGKELIYEQGDPGFDPDQIKEDEDNQPEEKEEEK